MKISFRKFYLFFFTLLAICIIVGYFRSVLSPANQIVQSFKNLSIQSSEPDCYELLKPNVENKSLQDAEKWVVPLNDTLTDSQLLQNIHSSCDTFLSNKNYASNHPSKEEKNFPLSFSILAFKSSSQIERLLRTIYRPWNYYCIHVDVKSDKQFLTAIDALVNCLNSKYNNIVNTKDRVDVKWGKMSVLTADLNCMKELYEKYKDWKYFINLTGQEFPLKTNAELVKILTAYKGANNLEGVYKKRNEERIPHIKMPFPVVWFKGSVHITVNRDFIAYIFESPKSKTLLNIVKGQLIPDETFFSTLNYNPQLRIPGSYIGNPDEITSEYFMTRYKNWGQYPCVSNKIVRGICIWGAGDLPKLVTAPNLFANKFHEEFQPATLRCLERWIHDKVQKEAQTGTVEIDSEFYSSLPFVKYQYNPSNDY